MNVGFAQDKLEADLGFSGAVYGFGAGVGSFLATRVAHDPALERAPQPGGGGPGSGRFTRSEVPAGKPVQPAR